MSRTETQQAALGQLPPQARFNSSILTDEKTPTEVTVDAAKGATSTSGGKVHAIATDDLVKGKDADPKDGSAQDKPLADKVEALGDALSGIDVKHLSSELLRDIIADISSRVKSVEESLKASQNVAQDSKSPLTSDSTTIKEELNAMSGSLPVVNYCNWEKFKNCYSKDEVCPAIDVLSISPGDNLDEQVEEEQIKRLPSDTTPDDRESYEKQRIRRNHVRHDKREDAMRVERVRIKSRPVLEFLARVTDETFLTDKPHTFLRPFKFLIHHHQKFEKEFRILEEKMNRSKAPGSEATGIDMPEAASDGLVESGSTTGAESVAKDVMPSDDSMPNLELVDTDSSLAMEKQTKTQEERTYDHIKCYMDFARSHLIPIYRKFETVDHVRNLKIRYEDIWSLFRPGELVFQRENESESANNNSDIHRSTSQSKKGPKVWRVHYIAGEGVDWEVPILRWTDDLRGKSKNLYTVIIDVYHLDFNGEQYEPVLWGFEFDRWEGEKSVTSLPLYPVRFHKDATRILDEYRERGEKFQKLLTQGHLPMEHNGWTLSRNPVGEPIKNNWEDTEPRPVFVSSDVIIDHQEALQSNPWWAPNFNLAKVGQDELTTTPPLTTKYDEFLVLVWSDAKRTTSLGHIPEIVIQLDNIERLEYHTLAQTDDFIVDPLARPFEKNTADKKLKPDDFALLPNRLFVYSLRDRKFVNADINNVKEITTIPDPWNDLKIKPHKLELIQSTVDDHFAKKRLERKLDGMGQKALEQDFIRSKGRGLVFLLHGPPGVGKTATAEAVAYAHRKPLFSLACFDLGVDPGTVEANLSEVFRLANLWDCVLLLDEADIFLSHREKKDDNLQRNAIVSTFLRTMEYYPGILFLTTNRPGALDEALSSRVHISLAFGDLDWEQTEDIFKMNIQRCKDIAYQRAKNSGEELTIDEDEILEFAEEEFHRCDPAPFWNGRVIRNSFQIAMSLAYVEGKKNNPTTKTTASDARTAKYMGRRQFKKVLTIFQDFKTYRETMFNKSDERLAHERGERAPGISLRAASKRESNHGMAGGYATANRAQRLSRSPQPHYHQEYSDGRMRDRRADHGARRRYDPGNEDGDRRRNLRTRSDRESDSEHRRQKARDRDGSRDYDRERERDRDDRRQEHRDYDSSARKTRNEKDSLEIPSDRRSRGSPREESSPVRGQRSDSPSTPSRRKGVKREDSDEEY